MRHRLFIPAATALLIALAACTRDEAAKGTLPAGEYPVIIQANGLDVTAAPASRATVDGDWQGVTSVALRLDGAVKEYTVTASDADGYRSATLSRTADPFYWTSRNDITVSAWWPYAETLPAVKVAEDQSTRAAFQGSDFISAENQTVTFSDPKLTFTHRTARVTVVLKPGTGIASVAGATVSLVSLSAEGSNPTAIKTCNTSGDTYEALTAPQTVAAGEPFIRVVLGDGNFYFRPQNDVVLEAGSRYTYTVNVNATGLTLAGCEIGSWSDGGGESGDAEDLGYIYNPNSNTYTVSNANGLLVWAEAAQNDLTIGCTLTADIDLTGKTWTPIDQYGISGYQGVFDGQGHCITGLAITTDDPYSESAVLFGMIGDRGTVKNLQLVNVDFNVIQNGVAGGIALGNYGTITACSVTGTITTAGGNPGGIAASNSGTITACWFKGTITGPYCSNIASYNNGTITACYYGENECGGVANNNGTADTYQINSGASWQTAVDGMNAALTGNNYQWTLGTDGLPVLVKQQP
ncbi:fimbrillin family protein [uncultured Alistipes sp.]|uniref:fimbrillin family protein n=1 Tax=uncultured Alistipes sp. TaxID=538949 RepID=UPI002637E87B|nr:fimbrillin family protein [uncultured Alistipes sp.]